MEPQLQFAANRDIKLGGVEYKKGSLVDVTGLYPHKLGQLLNQRLIVPVPTDT